MNPTISEKLKTLGYHKKWLEYGFLTEERLSEQYELYVKAVENPDEDEYGDRHTEHLRHESFIKIANQNRPLSEQELLQLAELVDLDSDSGMAKSGLKYILEKRPRTLLIPGDWGSLKAVHLHTKNNADWKVLLDGSNIEQLELQFEHKSIWITAIGLDDSVLIEEKSPKNTNNTSKKDLSKENMWSHAMGNEVIFFWTLTNTQGYTDGFQIQFGPIQKTTTIQALVAASKFHFYTAKS